MDFKKYLTFKGRINRKKFLFFHFIFTIVIILFSIYKPGNLIQSLLYWPLSLFINFISYTTSVQRLHDLNAPGIIILIPVTLVIVGEFTDIFILPLIAFGFICHMMIKKGTYGPNKYGNDPLTNPTEYVTLLNEL